VGSGTRTRRVRWTPRWRTTWAISSFRCAIRFADHAAVLLKLGFPLAAQRSLSALPRKVGPRACEARKGVLHPCKRHLEHGFPGVGPVREDLEDDLLPVDDGHSGKFLPIALLRGRQGRIKHDHFRAVLLRH
jgi:hypothetical protein